MDAHIRHEGFHDWNKEVTHETAYWAEYNSTGEGAKGERAPWVHKLTDAGGCTLQPYECTGLLVNP